MTTFMIGVTPFMTKLLNWYAKGRGSIITGIFIQPLLLTIVKMNVVDGHSEE